MNKCKCCVALADVDGLRQAIKHGGVKGQCAAGSLSAPLVCRCPPLLAISTPYLDVASHLSTAPVCGAVAKLHLLSSCVRLCVADFPVCWFAHPLAHCWFAQSAHPSTHVLARRSPDCSPVTLPARPRIHLLACSLAR